MLKRILIIIGLFYLLTLVQTSFLAHFNIFGIIPNLVLISVLIINFQEPARNSLGMIAAVSGGLFWDLFSANYFGYHILILLGMAIFIKLIIKKYVRLWTPK